MNGWRMRQEKTTVTRGTETERGTHDDWTSMDRMCGCMMYVWMKLESFLNADRQRERIAVIRTQDDDSIQPWKW